MFFLGLERVFESTLNPTLPNALLATMDLVVAIFIAIYLAKDEDDKPIT